MKSRIAFDHGARAASVIIASILAVLLVLWVQPAAQAASGTCVGTTTYKDLSFASTVTQYQRWDKTFTNGQAPQTKIYNSRSLGTVTQSVRIFYCKATGTSTWKLFSWSWTPNYGSGSVLITNNKIVDTDGPLTLVRTVGSNYVELHPFYCEDGQPTASMIALSTAKFVTGLPYPIGPVASTGQWAVNQVIPSVTIPRKCTDLGANKLTFAPDSIGRATWTSSAKSTGASDSLFLVHTVDTYAADGTWKTYESEIVSWRMVGK